MDKTPDHGVFCKVRQKIKAEKLVHIFNIFKGQLQAQGYMGKVFTFRGCLSPDFQRNETLPKVDHDSEARIGCKGGNKFWYGYKKHGLS